MKLSQQIAKLTSHYQLTHTPVGEKILSSIAVFFGVYLLTACANYISAEWPFYLPVLASMGASAFLMFVVPHSPMAQPWPLIGGHLLASIVGIFCAQTITDPFLATASAVSLSIFGMYWMHCLHPPSAATAMIAVLGGPEINSLGWKFCYELVAMNVGILFLLALIINYLIPGRRYPLFHTHHPHHENFIKEDHIPFTELNEDDFEWALSRMDGMVDVTREDLLDIYEFAVEHAESRKTAFTFSERKTKK